MIVADGREFEVVFDGGALLPERAQHPDCVSTETPCGFYFQNRKRH